MTDKKGEKRSDEDVQSIFFPITVAKQRCQKTIKPKSQEPPLICLLVDRLLLRIVVITACKAVERSCRRRSWNRRHHFSPSMIFFCCCQATGPEWEGRGGGCGVEGYGPWRPEELLTSQILFFSSFFFWGIFNNLEPPGDSKPLMPINRKLAQMLWLPFNSKRMYFLFYFIF